MKLPLPDGTITDDKDFFFASWDHLQRQIERLGFGVAGLSPGLMLYNKETGRGSFDLPVYVAEKIVSLILAIEEREQALRDLLDGTTVDDLRAMTGLDEGRCKEITEMKHYFSQ